MGYEGIFAPKYDPSYPPTHQIPPGRYDGAPTDGCALFVKSSRFALGDYKIARFGDLLPGDSLSRGGLSQVVIIAAILCHDGLTHRFTASVSHLKAGNTDPANQRVRRDECQAWTELMRPWPSPHVLCGDLNEDMAATPPDAGVNTLCRALRLQSAYTLGGHEPACTWAGGQSPACLDYILVPQHTLVRRLWAIPPEYHLSRPLHRVPTIPSVHYPSDHLAIAAQLVL